MIMIYKNFLYLLFAISLVLFASGFILVSPDQYGICPPESLFACVEPIGNNIGQPLMVGGAVVGLVLLSLLFLPEHFYRAWVKFAAWAIPFGVVWVIFTPVSCGNPLGVCLDKELVTWYAAGLILAVSLLVLLWHTWWRR